MKKICFVTTNRSDFSRMEPVLNAARRRDDLEVFLVAAGSHLLPDSGETIQNISTANHGVDARAYTIVEGENLETMSKSIGLGCIEFSALFNRLAPDVVVLHGDRFDIFPAAIAASMANIHIAHLQGGEITGTIDESIRHAITKLSHIHFVSNEDAANRVKKLGEDPTMIFNVGCPSIDFIKSISFPVREEFAKYFMRTYKAKINLYNPYLLLLQHPVTTEFENSAKHMEQAILTIKKTAVPTILIYPNIDAGSKQMTSKLRNMTGADDALEIEMFKHIPTHDFLTLLKYTNCIVGNSSAGIRESCYFGTPSVNIGSRQNGRMHGKNVQDVDNNSVSIFEAIQKQIEHGPYPVEEIYGSGHAAQKIVDIIAAMTLPSIQKRITY